jgi:hypothetical protein
MYLAKMSCDSNDLRGSERLAMTESHPVQAERSLGLRLAIAPRGLCEA